MFLPKAYSRNRYVICLFLIASSFWGGFLQATPRPLLAPARLSLGQMARLSSAKAKPVLQVGCLVLYADQVLHSASQRLALLCDKKRAQHNATILQKIAALHSQYPKHHSVRAPRNPLGPGGTFGESVEPENVSGITLPSDLFIPGSVTSPEFIGHLTGDVTGAASENVLKVGDSMTGDLIMTHQTGVQLQGSDDGNTVRLQAPAVVATGYDLTFPDTGGPAHAVLFNQGGGTLAWHDISPSSRYIQDGGNAVGDEITIGTQDNFPLGFITNSVERMWIETDGTIATNGRLIINAGGAEISGPVVTDSTMEVGGKITISSGGAYVVGNVEIDGDLDFDGNMDVQGTLTAGQKLTISSGGAEISGPVVTDSTMEVGGKITISSGGAHVTGNVEIDGDLDFDGNMEVGGTLTSGDMLTVSSGGAQISGGLKLPNQGALELYDSRFAQDRLILIRAPSIIAGSYTLELPEMIGVDGYVLGLRSSATGALEWIDIGADSNLVQAGGNDLSGPMTMGTLNADSVSLVAGGDAQLVVDPGGSTRINGTLTVARKVTVESEGVDITGPFLLQDQSPIRLYEAAPGLDYIELQSPNSIPATYTLTLPTNAGSSGQVLSTDGAGNLSWASSPAPAGAVMIGGNTVAATLTIGTNNLHALNLETNNTTRVAIGATTGAITFYGAVSAREDIQLEDQHQIVFEDSGSNTVALYAPTTISTSYALALPTADGLAGQVLTTDGAGQLSWSSGGTPSSAVLIGGNAVASTLNVGTTNAHDLRLIVGNTPRVSIAQATGIVTMSGALVVSNGVTAQDDIMLENQHRVVFGDTGSNTVALRAPTTIGTSYALTLPTADGTSGQVLTTDGSGNLSWSSGGSPTGAVLIGGNTVTSTMQIGTATASAHDLELITNGASRLVIPSDGVYGQLVDSGSALTILMDNTYKIGTNVSSRRFKTGIEDIGEDHDRFMQLRPVKYQLRSNVPHKPLYGFIAEELVDIYPELVVLDDEGHPLGVKEYLFAGILVNEIQRLAREVSDLRRQLDELID